MRRLLVALALSSCLGCAELGGLDPLLAPAGSGALDESTVIAGLKQALEVGADRSVARTSREDGYLGNPLIRIPVPESLDRLASGLRTVGLGSQVDELEVGMNRAAERAAGEAAAVFWGAIRGMTIADGYSVLRGGDTAATEYLRDRTSDGLRTRYEPIVAEAMNRVGLVSFYDSLVARYTALPFTTAPALDLREYVTDRALDGLFRVLGEEEQRIRENPAARSTELLQRVFASGTGLNF